MAVATAIGEPAPVRVEVALPLRCATGRVGLDQARRVESVLLHEREVAAAEASVGEAAQPRAIRERVEQAGLLLQQLPALRLARELAEQPLVHGTLEGGEQLEDLFGAR